MLLNYLVLRKGHYYFRWQIPVDIRDLLGQREIVKSLQTDNSSIAHQKALPYLALVYKILFVRDLLQSSEITEIQVQSLIAKQWEIVMCSSLPQMTGSFTVSQEIKAFPLHYDNTPQIPLLSEVYKEFRQHKINTINLSNRLLEQYDRDIKTILSMMKDKPIDQVTKADIKTCLKSALTLPVRNKKPYIHCTIQQLLGMEIPEEDLVQPKTVKQLEELLQGIFSYAMDEKGYVTSSPAKHLGLKLSKTASYAPFTNAEIVKLQQYAISLQDYRKWLVLLGIYTGARLGEIVQLRKKDIKFDIQSSRYYIFITRDAGSVKTENAIRKIPIHNNLIKYGFLDYVSCLKTVRLFEGVRSIYATQMFYRLRENTGVSYCDDYGQRKVFHSFRHTLITKARIKGVSDILIQQVVGHEKTKAGVTDRYTHLADLKDVLCVIDCLDFH